MTPFGTFAKFTVSHLVPFMTRTLTVLRMNSDKIDVVAFHTDKCAIMFVILEPLQYGLYFIALT